MMDAGITSECLIHNARLLGVDFSTIRGFVLSHGHFDHFGGLPGFLKIRGGNTPVYLHPEAFLERRVKFPPPYKPASMPHLDAEELKKSGGVIHQSRTMSLLASDCILATGEIVRIIPFEKGFPSAEAKIGGNWIADPFHDDQGLVVSVKNKGLVVISGCAHAGIINTVEHAKRLTGKEKVHAVLGGFHLTGAHFDPIIQPTIDEMKRIDPDYIIPMHCTGWKAINQFAQEMPEQFILNTVGTTYVFGES
jgi:7,8-dihydropterin-6-yl-methyl-4-(beta-D-ribofuranosyl)aminobenzene 5'-phosphate synthase